MKRILRSKRAVSPVVSILFLFGIILGAIAVSLGIIYPQIQTLNDNIELDTAGTSLLTLNNEIKTLILNGDNSKIFTNINNGLTGYFFVDTGTITTLSLIDGAGNLPTDQFTLIHPKFRIRQVLDSDPLAPGDNRYLIGKGNQNTLYLTTTNKDEFQWPILNQSRPLQSKYVYTSLSYRYILDNEQVISERDLSVNNTIEIQMVNVTLGGEVGVARTNPQIQVEYLGATTKFTQWYSMNNDVYLNSSTLASDPNSAYSVENPISIEAPLEATTQFKVRLKFVFHQLKITI